MWQCCLDHVVRPFGLFYGRIDNPCKSPWVHREGVRAAERASRPSIVYIEIHGCITF